MNTFLSFARVHLAFRRRHAKVIEDHSRRCGAPAALGYDGPPIVPSLGTISAYRAASVAVRVMLVLIGRGAVLLAMLSVRLGFEVLPLYTSLRNGLRTSLEKVIDTA
jgi:hypothetical protein